MKLDKEILNELKQVSPLLATSERGDTLRVDQQYFRDLSDAIVKKVRAEAEPQYYFVDGNPYNVPAGYFDVLADQILEKAKSTALAADEETAMISPLLSSISKRNLYAIPEGYFEQLSARPKEETRKTAEVISFKPNAWRRVARWVAAAVVTGTLGIGIYRFSNNASSVAEVPNPTAEVKRLSEDEIEKYLQNNSSSDRILPNIASENEDESQFRLVNISDNEIKEYLQDYGDTEGI